MIAPSYWIILRATDPRRAPSELTAYARREYGDADATWMLRPDRPKRREPRLPRAPVETGRLRPAARAIGSFLL